MFNIPTSIQLLRDRWETPKGLVVKRELLSLIHGTLVYDTPPNLVNILEKLPGYSPPRIVNQQRQEYQIYDMRGIDLSHTSLGNLSMSYLDLTGAVFDHCEMQEKTFHLSTLDYVSMAKCNIQWTNFIDCSVKHSIFDYTKFESINISYTDVEESSFCHVEFVNCRLSGFWKDVSARKVVFKNNEQNINTFPHSWRESNLDKASLNDQKIKGSCFDHSSFREANLINTDFSHMYHKDSEEVPENESIDVDDKNVIMKYSLRHANFQKANLTNAKFMGCDMEKANFEGANLKGADFRKGNLKGVCFKSANLSYADLRGANLSNVDFTDSLCHNTLYTYSEADIAFQTNITIHQKPFIKWRLKGKIRKKSFRTHLSHPFF